MATDDLDAFSKRIVRIADRIPERAARKQRKVFLIADQAIVLGTPVDTGRARSGWIGSAESPSDLVREAFAPGSRLGISETQNAAAAMAQAAAVAAAHRQGQTLYLTNNVAYIETLNRGRSPQAQRGFVEAGLARAVATVLGPDQDKLTE